MTKFSKLGLSEPILKVLTEIGFDEPSEIQQQAIPFLVGQTRDFIGMAQTGTGKTAAFGLPLLDNIDTGAKYTQALILAPTRELVQQIGLQLDAFGKYVKGLKLDTVYGGAPIMKQIHSIKDKSPQIIIATPGRLMDLMKRKVIDLSGIQTLILDEADEMLNMGFKDDIDTILKYTPEDSNTWLFSATMPKEIRDIIHNYMVDPVEVKIQPKNIVNQDISHHYYLVNRDDKTEALMRILDSEQVMTGIIFCRTKIETQKLADELSGRGYLVEALHGDMNQNQRDRVMQKFKTHQIRLLTATDVAARGIDVKNLSHVIHHSLPDDAEYYTHRSGRTARGGNKGVSLALATRGDLRKIDHLSKTLKVGISKEQVPTLNDVSMQRVANWVEDIKAAKADVSQDIMDEVVSQLATMSKQELVEKLVAMEIEKMNLKQVEIVEPSHYPQDDQYQDGKRGKSRRRSRHGGHGSHGGSFKSKKKSHGSKGGAPKNTDSSNSGGGDKSKKSKRHLSRRRR
ncbi:DEAD/DEAH box helicase [Marinoscillum sp. MHG1-6]|uniref:DEAD/DEAH box helicase n=1 Tax=Marinoscillum sp. MHG1-6 TaxID=2959627 RepID=UPI0021588D8A|nr:DEAD/DEAH box helicase [Marinoscillum sp. MHG1-6]